MSRNLTGWIAEAISTAGGLGYCPVAPGTAGSVGALVVAWVLVHYFGWKPWYFAVLAAAVLLPSIWAAHRTERDSGKEDPSKVVIDEVIGQWITFAATGPYGWSGWIGAFVLFRIFDILKPPPVRQAESIPGGAGIIADDVMAGIYGALVLFTVGCFNFK
jgi:phosphatidylglycerophosphatase A